MPFTTVEGPLYEYACHERHDGMEHLLISARAVEKAAAAATLRTPQSR